MRAVLENIPLAIDCVTELAKAAGFDEAALFQIQVAVDEACANVVQHAYPDDTAGEMEVSCSLDGHSFVVRVRDWGKFYDPDKVEKPDIEAPLSERSLGGLGLFLIHQYMDQTRYTIHPDAGNELVMVKRLQVAEHRDQQHQ